jgi:hypothetical protein
LVWNVRLDYDVFGECGVMIEKMRLSEILASIPVRSEKHIFSQQITAAALAYRDITYGELLRKIEEGNGGHD